MDRYPIFPPGLMRPDVNISITRGGSDGHNHDHDHDHDHGHSHDDCELPLAQATIGVQKWREIYERDKALMRGTIFCELDKPFRGSGR